MKTAALIAVAGLASASFAQVTVNLTHDDADSQLLAGESATWTLSVSFGSADGVVVSGGNMSITSNGLGTSSDFTYTDTNGGNNGGLSDGNGGIGFVNWTNSLFLESFGGGDAITDNPFVIGTYTFTAGETTGDVMNSVGLGEAISAFVAVDVSAFATNDYGIGDVAFNIQDLAVVVPSPASAGLLGLGGLVATRRRR